MSDLTNRKRTQIVETGRALFWKFGIRRVTIEEICREATVSKMTFYKHFRNKNELVKFIIDEIMAERKVRYEKVMNMDVPFYQKVERSIQLKLEEIRDLSVEFFNDVHRYASQDIRDHFRGYMEEGIRKSLSIYKEAQQKGDIRVDVKLEFIIYFQNLMIQLLRDPELVKLYASPRDLIMELTNMFFYGILAQQNLQGDAAMEGQSK